MTKPTKWLCAQWRLRSAWASAQSDQSSLSAWRKLGSLATQWAHSEDSDQTGRMLFFWEGPPKSPCKGNTSIKPSKSFFNNNSSQRQKKTRAAKPSPIKTIYKKFMFRLYRNWKKEEGAGGKIFFVWCVIGLFETLICAIAEDKVCDSCTVSSWAFLIFLLCL